MTMNDVFNFIERLAANNNRPWFAEHKAEFDQVRAYWLSQVQRIIDALAVDEPSLRPMNDFLNYSIEEE